MNGICSELCPHCEKEVELDNIFKVQTCPNCGKRILPCSICEFKTKEEENYYLHCDNCPLENDR